MATSPFFGGSPVTSGFPIPGSCHRPDHQFHLLLNTKEGFHATLQTQKRLGNFLPKCLSVKNAKSPIDNSDKGATEPARLLLERLFVQTQRLEEKMNRGFILVNDNEFSINLETIESDLQAALSAFRRKEEDICVAERKILLDYETLNHTRKDLDQREKMIASVQVKQRLMEDDLKRANDDLAFQGRQVEELKLLLEEQNQKIIHSQTALAFKEDELHKLRNEISEKNDIVTNMIVEIESRDCLLSEAYQVIEKQEKQVIELQKEVIQKENSLVESLHQRKLDEERLKIAESNLEKQSMEWLSTKKELIELAKQISKNLYDVNQNTEDIERVSALLSDVRSELIDSRKSLVSSRKSLEVQVHQLAKQQLELHEQRLSLMSYTNSIRDAHVVVEIERSKLDLVMENRIKINMQLSAKQAQVKLLEGELRKEEAQFKKVKLKVSSLQNELEQKESELSHAERLLQVKESELAEARNQIRQLKSEQASVKLILKDKDVILSCAQQDVANLNSEVLELKSLLKSKDDELMQATQSLQEKEKHMKMMQNVMYDTKIKFSEAATVIGRIAKLTDELVISMKCGDQGGLSTLDEHPMVPQLKHRDTLENQKKLDSKLGKENLSFGVKKIEILSAKRDSTFKNIELKMVHGKLELKENKMGMQKKSLEIVNSPKLIPDANRGIIQEAEREVAHLLTLTENLLKMAGIAVTS